MSVIADYLPKAIASFSYMTEKSKRETRYDAMAQL